MEEISFKEAIERTHSIAALWVGDWQIFYIDEESGLVWVEPENDYSDLLCWLEDRWVTEKNVPVQFRYRRVGK